MTAAVLIDPNSKLFGSKLRTTTRTRMHSASGELGAFCFPGFGVNLPRSIAPHAGNKTYWSVFQSGADDAQGQETER